MNEERCRRLVHRAVDVFGLDLSGLNVLTEAASGYFAVTPLLAALAGADRVFALARDSQYGTAETVAARSLELATGWGVEDRIDVITDREDARIAEADVVTNSGHLRPIDASLLKRLKATVAVPLMYETWEYRSADLDLHACRELDIPVLGTDESHSSLRTMQYIGHLAVKLLYEMDVEVCGSTVVVVGEGPFAQAAEGVLNSAGARVTRLGVDQLREIGANLLAGMDAMVVAEHERSDRILGSGGALVPADLQEVTPGLVVAHIAGAVDGQELMAAGIPCWPALPAPAGYMSVTTAYLGPRPMIDLYAAGLAVGASLARARRRGLSRKAAEQYVLRTCPYAQPFSKDFDFVHLPCSN